MNENKMAFKLRDQINKKVSKLDIPKFLLDEVNMLLDQVNYYKLTNIKNNIDSFLEYINDLNKQYTYEVADLVFNYKNQNEQK